MGARDVVGLGYSALDTIGLTPRLPQLDDHVLLEDLTRQGGGPVAQALVTLVRLGATAGFVGRIGDDDAGALIRAGLAEEGVDVAYLQTAPGARSLQSMILVDKDTGQAQHLRVSRHGWINRSRQRHPGVPRVPGDSCTWMVIRQRRRSLPPRPRQRGEPASVSMLEQAPRSSTCCRSCESRTCS